MSDATDEFTAVFREFAGTGLRDVWSFDVESERCLYIRRDVAERLEGHDPARYIDNERYGFITRHTYDDLTYADYEYTVRGFDEFTTFRTFFDGFGVLASVDADADIAFDALYETLRNTEYAHGDDTGLIDDYTAAADD
ncbi:DUF7522 family protein [Halorarius halobius]|uniref:DUF7522 family protein n=1 Tax=Halorarius halobius TaxID=2962671 RepID=UPI0020CF5F4D|nr:hypothetical protein [Halorarius halobius]